MYQQPGNPGYPPPYPQPPRKNNTALIVGLVVVIVAAVVALVLVLVLRDGKSDSSTGGTGGSGSGDSTGSAQALGQKVVDVIQNHSGDEAERLVCKSDSKFLRTLSSIEGTEVKATLTDVAESGDTADVKFDLTRVSDGKVAKQKVSIKKVDEKWCIN
ncbi:hypothetical protein [Kibdelosporangium phytohabitans]|uniref:DUF4878 domain-containing protein n=1 Tax=Kibdelosporangium phytohabitans TaxID=860235 RepID=A0A0N9I1R4_9PSEU|nr:hypothetical protein [Kibdelosporangium phytohabitans]ALG08625.1 hypothetical protein AOZ06_18390 [Kibdelosporangium phytohabitans]MBE1470285.1 hypothetical protein [Kibdelosporangium phytohabitans]